MSTYKLNALESPVDERDFKAEDIFPADLSLPEVYDPRNKLLPIRNQGVQGSCVAQSCAAMKEAQEQKNVGFNDYFSPQFIYNNRVNQEGEGMYPRDSMKILFHKGIVPEEDYPYGIRQKPEDMHQSTLEIAANYKTKGYAYITDIKTLKAAIYRNGACAFTVSVYDSGPEMWKSKYDGNKIIGGHAMVAVGWNKEGFIIRNSWGENWGDKGYTVFPYSDWDYRGEIWTVIDDESSKPDPRYSKWYWKVWRAIKNTILGLNSLFYTLLMAFILFTGAGFKEWTAWIVSIGILGFIVYKSIFDKLYLFRK